MKRIFDVCCACSFLILLSPLYLFVAVLIFMGDKGPVFYKQTRVGKFGKPFRLYKFRSMRIDADKTGEFFTIENDCRITKVGRLLRKTSIDELPQLINVLFGEMSIVGPRPNVPQQEELYEPTVWIKRNSVLPGVTGLAQAAKRSAATQQERNNYDLEYVSKASMLFDFYIIFLTIQQVVFKGGN